MKNDIDIVKTVVEKAQREADLMLYLSNAFDKAMHQFGEKRLAMALRSEHVAA